MCDNCRVVSGPSRDNPDMIVHDLYEPCAPRAPGAQEMNWTQIEGEKLKEPLVSMVSTRVWMQISSLKKIVSGIKSTSK